MVSYMVLFLVSAVALCAGLVAGYIAGSFDGARTALEEESERVTNLYFRQNKEPDA